MERNAVRFNSEMGCAAEPPVEVIRPSVVGADNVSIEVAGNGARIGQGHQFGAAVPAHVEEGGEFPVVVTNHEQ